MVVSTASALRPDGVRCWLDSVGTGGLKRGLGLTRRPPVRGDLPTVRIAKGDGAGFRVAAYRPAPVMNCAMMTGTQHDQIVRGGGATVGEELDVVRMKPRPLPAPREPTAFVAFREVPTHRYGGSPPASAKPNAVVRMYSDNLVGAAGKPIGYVFGNRRAVFDV